ncbi:MAG: aminomethyl-transferring glycine dehydrogenase subunit GcvPA [Deltaproteobacteria bacterium]|nr:aminomethyl-transferring glycine dehydrogenase subunit GcvPA [Deltaproteobacteria bacterium]
MRYLPHTEDEIRSMLATIGVPSLDALFDDVPTANRLGRPLAIDPALPEAQLMGHLEALAHQNDAARALSFLGAGLYEHHIPPAMDQLLLRSEFYTAYTPYQAEVSQGTLQAIFEFQTIVCELLGMEIANASMYDAASATAEAVLMARRVTGRLHVAVSEGVHPESIQTIETYLRNVDHGEKLVSRVALGEDGRTDTKALEATLRDDTAVLVVGYPNFMGCVEDLEALRAITKARGVLLVTATHEPYALSMIKAPGQCGVDIAVGEGQALAVPPQMGGPGVGLFAIRSGKELLNQMPGRLCGETVDQKGERGFVLTLSTREQHIRREKATSNICTNHGLIALAMTIRTAMLGKKGFLEVGRACLAKSEYLKKKLLETGKFSLPYSAPTYNEFVVRRNEGAAAPLLAALAAKGILGGVALARWFPPAAPGTGHDKDFLVAVTERHSREDLDRFVAALASV